MELRLIGRRLMSLSRMVVDSKWYWYHHSGRKMQPHRCQNCNRPAKIREFKIPGRLTSKTLTLSTRDWVDDDYLGGKLFTLRSRFQAEDDNVLFIMASLERLVK